MKISQAGENLPKTIKFLRFASPAYRRLKYRSLLASGAVFRRSLRR